MSFKAWIVKPKSAKDAKIIQKYISAMEGVAFYSGAVKFTAKNFNKKAGDTCLLLTVDRADILESVQVECGYSDFAGTANRIEEFESESVEQDGVYTAKLNHCEYLADDLDCVCESFK